MRNHRLPGMALFALALAAGWPARADELLLRRVQQEQSLQLPPRGMRMAEVERRYGPPVRKLDPRGGDSPKHPLIQRWQYDGYIVYFERDRVIHSVLDTPVADAHARAAP
ncbi:hypothetical protein [Aerosticca soli]|uniref:Uncharacterized protein n=1 Tax=Aerosticca soli TaxID=2010829 RepID=A0A2Z6E4I4_9GAMM|nr:hypothetical protein [Aerosticca soli]BBD79990.1 hypothetical protein ALSL_1333 [Aerosticca soli]